MPRPRLLFVSPRFLLPADQGGKIRTGGILRHMKGGAFEIVLASPAPAGHEEFAAGLQELADRFVWWPEPRASLFSRLMAAAGPTPVSAASDRSARGAALVRELSGQADLVVADFPHAAVLLPPGLPASVMFTHNVEAEILERHAEVARGGRQLVWRNEARKMRAFEARALRRFDTVIAVSRRDAEALARRYALSRVEVIDTGVDLVYHAFQPARPPPPAEGGTVVFTGAMDWRANIDGAVWLMDEVWPLVTGSRPRARAAFIGRNPPSSLAGAARARGIDWTFTGYVDDVRPHVAAGDVYVIPLRVGSGTRIKVFEAMAAGRPVVSTTLGVEGLDVRAGEHLLVANIAADFAAAILRLLGDPAEGARLARAARDLVARRFSHQHVARRFEALCAATLARGRTGGRSAAAGDGRGADRAGGRRAR